MAVRDHVYLFLHGARRLLQRKLPIQDVFFPLVDRKQFVSEHRVAEAAAAVNAPGGVSAAETSGGTCSSPCSDSVRSETRYRQNKPYESFDSDSQWMIAALKVKKSNGIDRPKKTQGGVLDYSVRMEVQRSRAERNESNRIKVQARTENAIIKQVADSAASAAASLSTSIFQESNISKRTLGVCIHTPLILYDLNWLSLFRFSRKFIKQAAKYVNTIDCSDLMTAYLTSGRFSTPREKPTGMQPDNSSASLLKEALMDLAYVTYLEKKTRQALHVAKCANLLKSSWLLRRMSMLPLSKFADEMEERKYTLTRIVEGIARTPEENAAEVGNESKHVSALSDSNVLAMNFHSQQIQNEISLSDYALVNADTSLFRSSVQNAAKSQLLVFSSYLLEHSDAD